MKRSIVLPLAALIGAFGVLVPLGAGAPPPPASLVFTPTTSAGTYNYGELAFGATASQTFTLRNSGGTASGALTISLTGSAFTKTADTCTAISVGAGKSCSVTVRYSPSAAGASDTGQLGASNKKKQPTTAILALAGAGAVSRYIYWVNGASSIGRAGIDGSNPNQSFMSGINPIYVAVDGSYIYWANYITDSIGRANRDGSNPNPSFISGASDPIGIAVDSNYVYWSNIGTNTIGRANLDGSNPNQSFMTGVCCNVYSIAVDSNYIYWGDLNANSIGRANLDGSNPNGSFITGAANGPWGVAVDANYVYWGNQYGGSIGRANLDGSNPNQQWIFYVASPMGVAVDSSYIYWANLQGTVGRANLDGSSPNESFITGAYSPYGLAIDSE